MPTAFRELLSTWSARAEAAEALEDPRGAQLARRFVEELEGVLEGYSTPSATPTTAVPGPDNPAAPKVVTADAVAEMLDVNRQRVYELARTGALPCIRLGRQIRFSTEAVHEYVARGGHDLAA